MRSQGALLDARDNAGDTPMHTAARLGLRKVVAVLLDLGADPLLRNTNNGDGSLHMAAQAGCTTLMARFIDLGIDVDAKADNGRTVLHLVSQAGDTSCVRMLLDEGAAVNEADDDGWTPLRHAAGNNKVEALESLLDVGKGDLFQTHHFDGNLLHTAAYNGSTATMQLLVDRGLDVGSTIESNGETVLHNAAQRGKELAVKWLLDNGASLDDQDHQGRTPQTFAVDEGTSDEAVQSALEAIAESEDGNDRMSVVWEGWSLLHLAAAKGFAGCVRFLVSKGAGVDSKTADGEEQVAMHCAVRNNFAGVVVVLAKYGACVDSRDSSGETPLYLAATADDQLELVTTLLELGASCNIADNSGRTPLWAAAENGNLACCSLLVAKGADMSLRDTHGENALGASLAGRPDTRASRDEVMKLLIDLGCPVGEAEINAASRGELADSFAKAVTARMGGGTAARELAKATSMARSHADASPAIENVGGAGSDAQPAVSMTTVRVSSEPPSAYLNKRHRAASTSLVANACKVNHVNPAASPSCLSSGRARRGGQVSPSEAAATASCRLGGSVPWWV